MNLIKLTTELKKDKTIDLEAITGISEKDVNITKHGISVKIDLEDNSTWISCPDIVTDVAMTEVIKEAKGLSKTIKAIIKNGGVPKVTTPKVTTPAVSDMPTTPAPTLEAPVDNSKKRQSYKDFYTQAQWKKFSPENKEVLKGILAEGNMTEAYAAEALATVVNTPVVETPTPAPVDEIPQTPEVPTSPLAGLSNGEAPAAPTIPAPLGL